MELAKVNEDGTLVWPYTFKDLRSDNSNVSFPKDSEMDAEFLLNWNVYPVISTPEPEYNPETQYVSSATPVKTEAGVEGRWNVREISQDRLEENIRSMRDTLLQQTDVHILRAYEAGESPPADWVAYRTALRDIPAQEGFPTNVTWPTKPS